MVKTETTPLLLLHTTLRKDGSLQIVSITDEEDRSVREPSKRQVVRPCIDGESGNKTDKSNFWNGTNLKQKALFAYLCFINFLCILCTSVATPFLARVLIRQGGSVLLSTFVLQISMITMTVSCFVIPKYQSRVGSKKMIIFAQVIFSICQVVFGTIGYYQSQWALVVVGVTLRATQGVCQAAFVVCGLTSICHEFTNFVSIVFGIFEASFGIGFLTGSYVGGFLYDVSGGMMVPLAATGSLTLFFSILGIFVLKNVERGENSTSGFQIVHAVSQPKAVLIVSVGGTSMGGLTTYFSTVTVYLKIKGFSVTDTGQLLCFMGITFSIVGAFVGRLVNSHTVLRRLVMCAGVIGTLILPLLLTNDQNDDMIYVSTIAFVVCATVSVVLAFYELLHILEAGYDPAELDQSFYGAVSGLWNATLSMFDFVIPMIASAMDVALPYSISLSSSFVIAHGFGILFAGLLILFRLCQ